MFCGLFIYYMHINLNINSKKGCAIASNINTYVISNAMKE